MVEDSDRQKEEVKEKDEEKDEEEDNVITYNGFGFSGWKSGLQRLFLL